MQISITAGIPDTELRDTEEVLENTKNPEMTEE